jgi:hypothetical protein
MTGPKRTPHKPPAPSPRERDEHAEARQRARDRASDDTPPSKTGRKGGSNTER